MSLMLPTSDCSKLVLHNTYKLTMHKFCVNFSDLLYPHPGFITISNYVVPPLLKFNCLQIFKLISSPLVINFTKNT
jgi:hypothetical protein